MNTTTLAPADISEASLRDYFDLLKPRVMTLVVFTGLVGMALAPGFATLHPLIAAVGLVSLAIGAGAAGAINMWYDRDIDAIMTRTRTRPIPAGRIPADEAIAFALTMATLSVMTMGICVSWVAAGMLAFSILFYGVLYTMILKRATDQNIVIGGAAGAFPPVIGYLAAGGDFFAATPWILFALIFFWTPPHFWALSILIRDEYAAAKIPMLPVVKGDAETARQMMVYTVLMGPISALPVWAGFAGVYYGAVAALLWAGFMVSNIRVLRDPGNARVCKQMFGYSIFYLFALFLALLLNQA